MLNKAPIFINGFARGGTTILMNLLASHPDVATLASETHRVFYGKPREPIRKWVRRFFYLPVLATTRRHVFKPSQLEELRALPRPLMYYIDALFYWSKVTAHVNRIQFGNTTKPFRQIAQSRLLGKNINGVVFTTPLFASMYPDATFVAIVRNGLALCESYVRRGGNAREVGIMYEKVCQKMIHDSKTMKNYHIVRFEDIMSDVVSFTTKVYANVCLDISVVDKFTIRARSAMDKDGVRKTTFGKERESGWFRLEEINGFLRKDVNENQIARLSERDKQIFLDQASGSMAHFGYLG